MAWVGIIMLQLGWQCGGVWAKSEKMDFVGRTKRINAEMPRMLGSGTMMKMLWALLSYPLSLLMICMEVALPRDALPWAVYLLALFLTWIVLALWFGISYFKYARLKDVLGWLILMTVHILSLVLMFLVMTIPWVKQETIMSVGDAEVFVMWFSLVPVVLCFIVFSAIGLTCTARKQRDRGDGDMHDPGGEKA